MGQVIQLKIVFGKSSGKIANFFPLSLGGKCSGIWKRAILSQLDLCIKGLGLRMQYQGPQGSYPVVL